MKTVRQIGQRSLTLAQDLGLLIIAVATIVAIGFEVVSMIRQQVVGLADLLLLFIYLEVLAMVSIYLQSGKLPIRIPLYIAIVALARYMILDMKAMDSWKMITVAVAALILALTVLVIRYGHIHYPYNEEGHH